MKFLRIILCGLLALILAPDANSAEAVRVLAVKPAPELDALFQRTNGWAGADGNYSVALTPEHLLWFFSDTWIGSIAGGRRTNVTLINNSVGVQTGRGTNAMVEFFWGRQTNGRPAALIVPQDGRGWFWPLGGCYDAGRVWVLMHQLEKAGEGAFGFRVISVSLGEVENPLDSPAQWRVRQRKLPFTEVSAQRHRLFGAAVMQHGGQIYIYGTEERPQERGFGRRMILARVESGAVGEFARWRFFGDGVWHEDFRRVTPLAPGIATEYSVTWSETLGRFVTVGNDVFLSPKIVARTAPEPWGPWSGLVTLFSAPEADWSKSVFCYAGKAHASLSRSDELVITYAANSREMSEVIRDPRLYWPRFMRVKVAAPARD